MGHRKGVRGTIFPEQRAERLGWEEMGGGVPRMWVTVIRLKSDR